MLHNEFANAAIDAAKAGTAVPRRRRSARIAKQTEPGTSQQGPGAPPANQLHSFDALPDYLRDNEFIITGYRHTLPVRDSLKSLFNLHNETGNIWSHFIGEAQSRQAQQRTQWTMVMTQRPPRSEAGTQVHPALLPPCPTTAGFILFVVLTIWMVNSPPTPAILARPHFEQLWQAVSRNLPELKGSVGENLIPRALQDSWQSGVHTLHEWEKGLQERVHGIQETVSESVHTLQESVHSIQVRTRALFASIPSPARQLRRTGATGRCLAEMPHRMKAVLPQRHSLPVSASTGAGPSAVWCQGNSRATASRACSAGARGVGSRGRSAVRSCELPF